MPSLDMRDIRNPWHRELEPLKRKKSEKSVETRALSGATNRAQSAKLNLFLPGLGHECEDQ